MKKLIAVLAPLSFALTACVATTGTTTNSTTGTSTSAPTVNAVALAAVKVGVQAKCITELNNNTYWQTGSKILTESKKQQMQTEVCSCVGEKATSTTSAADLLVAALDKTSQATLINRVVTSTLNACVIETLKN